MWTVDDEMQTFSALPYRDKWRVSRCLVRGEAPRDPRKAAAAVELAESYQRQRRRNGAFLSWLPVALIILSGCFAVIDAVEGDLLGVITFALIVLGSIGQLMFNPITRPKNMARALEASRRIAAAGAYLEQEDRSTAAWQAQWRKALEGSAGVAPKLGEGSEYVEDIRRADAERLSRVED
jgi:hypothetical protein